MRTHGPHDPERTVYKSDDECDRCGEPDRDDLKTVTLDRTLVDEQWCAECREEYVTE